MGTPIDPTPNDFGFACGVCNGPGQLLEHGTPDRVRVTYSGVQSCPTYPIAPDGPYILPQKGPAAPCQFTMVDGAGLTHVRNVTPAPHCHIVYIVIGIKGYEFFHDVDGGCDSITINFLSACLDGLPVGWIGHHGFAVTESLYPADPEYYAYGSGLFPDRSMKYDSGPCTDGDTWFRFCSVPDRINCMVKGNTAEV